MGANIGSLENMAMWKLVYYILLQLIVLLARHAFPLLCFPYYHEYTLSLLT